MMARPTATLVGALVLTAALLLAVWAAQGAGSTVHPDPADVPADSSAATLVADLAAGTQVAPPSGREQISDAAPAPTMDGAGQQPTAGSFAVLVRVVRADTGAAVPAAEVAVMAQKFVWSAMTDAEKEVVHRFGRDEVGMLAHFGRRVQADAGGLLRLTIDRDLFLACQHESLFGKLHVQASQLRRDEIQQLILRPEATLQVRVSTATGQPVVGLAVGLRPRWSEPLVAALHKIDTGAVAFAYTDQTGHATLRHLLSWVDDYPATARPDGAAVRLLAAGNNEDTFEFNLSELPGHVVELIAPAMGEVVVKAFDAQGQPIGQADDFCLRLAGNARHEAWGGTSAGRGAARFGHVVLGRRFEASFTGLVTLPPEVFVGPNAAGQTVFVEMHATGTGTALTCQLTGIEGLAVVSLRIQLHGPNFSGGGWNNAVADASGRVRCELDNDWVGEVIQRVVVTQVTQSGVTPLVATIDRMLTLAAGDNDLGIVELKPAPHLVSGTVSIDGKPSPQRPELTIQIPDTEGNWRDLRTTTVSWPTLDEFVVVSPPAGARYRLIATSVDSLPSEPIEFTPGQTDLRVELTQGGALRCTMALDDPTLAEQVTFTLTPDHPTPAAERALRARGRSPSGQFEPADDMRLPSRQWRGLVPGSYRLTAHGLGSPRPLLDLAALEVRSGAECADARLTAIDLRGKLRRLQLRVLDADGAPLAGIAIARTIAAENSLGVMVVHGHGTLLTAAPTDLQVVADGYHTALAQNVVSDHVVRLTHAPTFRLALPEVAVPTGVTAELSIEPKGLPTDQIATRLVNSPDGRLWRSRPLVTTLPLGTARRVDVSYREGEALALSVGLTAGGHTVVVVGHTPTQMAPPTGESVELSIPAAAWNAALAALRR